MASPSFACLVACSSLLRLPLPSLVLEDSGDGIPLLRLPLPSLVLEGSGDGIPVKPGHGEWVSGADRYAGMVRSDPACARVWRALAVEIAYSRICQRGPRWAPAPCLARPEGLPGHSRAFPRAQDTLSELYRRGPGISAPPLENHGNTPTKMLPW